ncbi:MAG: cysteine hydrolase [Patescibacteria group bacterium]|nr:cysteine hydrolase [Patescibacteria group bacterium]
MKIFIPNYDRKKALIVVDMQEGFLKTADQSIVSRVKNFIEQTRYDLYVEAVFHADKGSLWDKQTGWTFELEPTVPELRELLQRKNSLLVTKTTKSVFDGDRDLIDLFKEKGIEEVHIVGVDTNDCVMATAYDSFDADFFTYVIEECVASSSGKKMHDYAIEILRNTDLTNHSELIGSKAEIAL